MSNQEKINQLIAGIMCEYNSQCSIRKDLLQIETCSYPKIFEEHEKKLLQKLHDIFEEVCDFSNDCDINEDWNIVFNHAILKNLQEEETN